MLDIFLIKNIHNYKVFSRYTKFYKYKLILLKYLCKSIKLFKHFKLKK